MASYYNHLYLVIDGFSQETRLFFHTLTEALSDAILADQDPAAAKGGDWGEEITIAVSEILEKHSGNCPGIELRDQEDPAHPGAFVIGSDENIEIDYLALMLQATMRRFNLPGPITFQWSSACTQDKADAFGGGAGIVTPDEIRIQSTREWLEDQLAEIAPDIDPESVIDTAQRADGSYRLAGPTRADDRPAP